MQPSIPVRLSVICLALRRDPGQLRSRFRRGKPCHHFISFQHFIPVIIAYHDEMK